MILCLYLNECNAKDENSIAGSLATLIEAKTLRHFILPRKKCLTIEAKKLRHFILPQKNRLKRVKSFHAQYSDQLLAISRFVSFLLFNKDRLYVDESPANSVCLPRNCEQLLNGSVMK